MDNLLNEIRDYCDRVGIKPTTFGVYAAGDGKLVKRLESGGQCLPRTVERIRAYIADNPAVSPQSSDAA